MKLRGNDTIAAIATPLGTGAISIVRMSGPDAIPLAETVFRGSHHLHETPGYTIRRGHIIDSKQEPVDEVLVAVFRSPHSYTGEDAVEINCHGGSFVTKKVLSTLLEVGARQADPGEFTKRAFLNGKMDLSQAEGVADLISAGSERALRNSRAQLDGALGKKVHSIRDELLRICSLLELQLDFDDEDGGLVTEDSLRESLNHCAQEIASSIKTYGYGRIVRDGASVAIVGRPNVGKSSLFNRLLMFDRSIVSWTPGTTRDFLEESLIIDGFQIRLFDTAGLRVSSDAVEVDGISRTLDISKMADLVILVVDKAQEDDIEEDLRLVSVDVHGKVVVVKNKIDLDRSRGLPIPIRIGVSAATGEGLEELRKLVMEEIRVTVEDGESSSFVSSNRHIEALRKSKDFIEKSRESLARGLSAEFVSLDVRSAIDAIAEITGEVTTDDILDGIFSKFCIGK